MQVNTRKTDSKIKFYDMPKIESEVLMVDANGLIS